MENRKCKNRMEGQVEKSLPIIDNHIDSVRRFGKLHYMCKVKHPAYQKDMPEKHGFETLLMYSDFV